MTSSTEAFLLACLMLLSFAYAEETQLSPTPVGKMVEYEYGIDFSQMIPGVEYSSYINAKWSAPVSALSGLDGKTITVKVTASADESSDAFFLSQQGERSKQVTYFLYCVVQGGGCSSSSVLSAKIPLIISLQEGQGPKITLESEIQNNVQPETQEGAAGQPSGEPGGQPSSSNLTPAEEFLQSLAGALSANETNNSSEALALSLPSLDILNFSSNSSNESFLDSLKPEGDSRDPISFLRENPLVTLTALVIVIIITGAYLLRSKD